MSEDIHHECGVAAMYWLDESPVRPGLASESVHDGDVAPLMPAMLLDLQNRGQLAAGFSSYSPDRAQLLDTYKDIGTVTEAFRMSHPAKHQAILTQYAGKAAMTAAGKTQPACDTNPARTRHRRAPSAA